jgi:quercetin dioxygenase-like cupin family protein
MSFFSSARSGGWVSSKEKSKFLQEQSAPLSYACAINNQEEQHMNGAIFDEFSNGQATVDGVTTALGTLPWVPHKDFEGVYLKHLIPGDKTGNAFACLLVRIDPGKKIGLHSHPNDLELHEVISGYGSCVTAQGDIDYAPGSMAVLPANSPHEVQAGDQGLCLFAKFVSITEQRRP